MHHLAVVDTLMLMTDDKIALLRQIEGRLCGAEDIDPRGPITDLIADGLVRFFPTGGPRAQGRYRLTKQGKRAIAAPPTPRGLSEEQKAQIIALASERTPEGWRIEFGEIAKRFGVSAATISRIVRAAGIIRGSGLPFGRQHSTLRPVAVALLGEGLNRGQIARALGVSRQAIEQLTTEKRRMPSHEAVVDFWRGWLAEHGISPAGCFSCGCGGELERAHIVPRHPPHNGSDDADNLHLLCRPCHLESEPIADRATYMAWILERRRLAG